VYAASEQPGAVVRLPSAALLSRTVSRAATVDEICLALEREDVTRDEQRTSS
jgi:hypothetical protein